MLNINIEYFIDWHNSYMYELVEYDMRWCTHNLIGQLVHSLQFQLYHPHRHFHPWQINPRTTPTIPIRIWLCSTKVCGDLWTTFRLFAIYSNYWFDKFFSFPQTTRNVIYLEWMYGSMIKDNCGSIIHVWCGWKQCYTIYLGLFVFIGIGMTVTHIYTNTHTYIYTNIYKYIQHMHSEYMYIYIGVCSERDDSAKVR